MNIKLLFFLTLFFCFVCTAVFLRILIPVLKSRKMGQKILDIGPRWHKSKEGTPTMGGLAFLASSVLIGAIAIFTACKFQLISNLPALLLTAGFALLNGVIGTVDDSAKLMKKQNAGLTALQKYSLQFIVAIAYLVCMVRFAGMPTSLPIPFLNVSIHITWVFGLICLLTMTGVVNSVNLADGIDGLCASETAVVGAFFAIVAFMQNNAEAALLSALVIGSCLGFLVYNWHPARVFMGDTGSLFLGGTVVGLAFLCQSPTIILICGFMYVLEAISDILQVFFYKTTGKRVFLMAPIHHHFEKKGWGEVKVVTVFTLLTTLLCLISYFGLPT